ncbi:unnamed protein product, partial [Ectocarpus sp. 12 AP-2014]
MAWHWRNPASCARQNAQKGRSTNTYMFIMPTSVGKAIESVCLPLAPLFQSFSCSQRYKGVCSMHSHEVLTNAKCATSVASNQSVVNAKMVLARYCTHTQSNTWKQTSTWVRCEI